MNCKQSTQKAKRKCEEQYWCSCFPVQRQLHEMILWCYSLHIYPLATVCTIFCEVSTVRIPTVKMQFSHRKSPVSSFQDLDLQYSIYLLGKPSIRLHGQHTVMNFCLYNTQTDTLLLDKGHLSLYSQNFRCNITFFLEKTYYSVN